MSHKKAILSRRNFLLTAGAGGVAGAAAFVGRNAATTAPGGKDKRATGRYQASRHVENYYRTAKV